MRISLKYVSASGRTIYLDRKPYVYQDNGLLSHKWTVTKTQNRITGFNKPPEEYPLKIRIWSKREEYADDINRLMEIFEPDVINRQPGRLYLNDEYLSCYISSTNLTDWRNHGSFCNAEFKVIAEYPFWINEMKKSFFPTSSLEGGSFRFPFKFPFGFTKSAKESVLFNRHYSPCKSKIVFYGPAENPDIMISGNTYAVNCTLLTGERLEIDGISKTILKISATGEKENEFNARNKAFDAFKPIPAGENGIDYNGAFGFDVILYAERGLPKWI